MSAHRLRLLSLAALLTFTSAFAHAAAPAAPRRPNILFFITDDQYKDMMNFLPQGKDAAGRDRNLTPATDRLAAEAMIMDRMYVTSPVCTPSRYGCLTGQYPSRARSRSFLQSTAANDGQTVVEWNTFITPDQPNTLPRLLNKAGYFTGIVGKNHVIQATDTVKPQWTDDPRDPAVKAILQSNREIVASACRAAGFDYAASIYDDNPAFINIEALFAHNQDWITRGALDFIDAAQGRPFFLWLASTLPHGPQESKRSWKADPLITADGFLEKPLQVQAPRRSIEERLKAAGLKSSPIIGAGGIRTQPENTLWLDDSLDAVLKKLADTGELENTIIVYFNDHGQLAKGTVYEGGVHTESFLWRQGGWPGGHRTDALIENVDFAPTLLDLAGIPFDPALFDGRSFAPVLLGTASEPVRKSLYFELGYVRGVLKDGWKYIALRYPESVRNMSSAERQKRLDRFNAQQRKTGRPVYTEDPSQPFSHISLVPGGGDAEHASLRKYPAFFDADQLYNLADDPTEQLNLASSPAHAAKLAEMKAELRRYLASLPGHFAEF
jgi:arylsulfatase A-like enzyme